MPGKRPATSPAPGETGAKRHSRADSIGILKGQIKALMAELATALREKDSNAESDDPVRPCPFKDLPRVLRNEVYRHIIHGPQSTLYVKRPIDSQTPKPGAIGGHPHHQAILLVDRQLNREVSDFMTKQGQLTFQFGCRKNEARCTNCQNCQTNHVLDQHWWVKYTDAKDVQTMIRKLCNRYHHVYIELVVDRGLPPQETKRLHSLPRWFLGQYGKATRYSTDFTTGGQCRTIIEMGSLFRTHDYPMCFLLPDYLSLFLYSGGRSGRPEFPPPPVVKFATWIFSIICDVSEDEANEESEVSRRFDVLRAEC
ncbi:uncharacterized protein BDZ99DRAFT_577606 [Mytilinidion resinicola]|uniref:Uncharacterized protein n=1 Tax=Mytilinidion resinicola TaxID=574789 RepID=A0A6A6Y0Z3_9PEZI|nr:uncharacterized protein BDZ99DRAFT_577606 [Mytilinidion resinicola]KAF2801477.1 hypothetical protein BDZ99DRAFT_577606 [Mytilinidion resinicola]